MTTSSLSISLLVLLLICIFSPITLGSTLKYDYDFRDLSPGQSIHPKMRGKGFDLPSLRYYDSSSNTNTSTINVKDRYHFGQHVFAMPMKTGHYMSSTERFFHLRREIMDHQNFNLTLRFTPPKMKFPASEICIFCVRHHSPLSGEEKEEEEEKVVNAKEHVHRHPASSNPPSVFALDSSNSQPNTAILRADFLIRRQLA